MQINHSYVQTFKHTDGGTDSNFTNCSLFSLEKAQKPFVKILMENTLKNLSDFQQASFWYSYSQDYEEIRIL